MTRALMVAASVLIPGVLPTHSAARPPVALRELTVPQERLPAGCATAPSNAVRLDGNRVLSGLWTGLPIDENPWMGNDPHVVGAIRERMDGPVRVPDGPPATRRELSQYRLQLSEGVEEAYAAVYRQPDPEQPPIIVYGSRFSEPSAPVQRPAFGSGPGNEKILRLTIGSTVVVLHGDGGACSAAIGAYLRSLAQP
jgi:hypothetical protein